MTDNVNHPSHYVNNSVTVTYEPIDLCRLYDFSTGNAIKYLIRYKSKGKPIEDLQKARWYLEDALHNLFSELHIDFNDCKSLKMRDCIKGFREKNHFIKFLIDDQGALTAESIHNTVKAINEEIEGF